MQLFKIKYYSFDTNNKLNPFIAEGWAVGENGKVVRDHIDDLTYLECMGDVILNIYKESFPPQKLYQVKIPSDRFAWGYITAYAAVSYDTPEEEIIAHFPPEYTVTYITNDIDYSIQGWRLKL